MNDEIITETLDSMADSLDDSYKLDGEYRAYAAEKMTNDDGEKPWAADLPAWGFDICVTGDKWCSVAIRHGDDWEMLIEGGVVYRVDEFTELVEIIQGGLVTIIDILKSCAREGMTHD